MWGTENANLQQLCASWLSMNASGGLESRHYAHSWVIHFLPIKFNIVEKTVILATTGTSHGNLTIVDCMDTACVVNYTAASFCQVTTMPTLGALPSSSHNDDVEIIMIGAVILFTSGRHKIPWTYPIKVGGNWQNFVFLEM